MSDWGIQTGPCGARDCGAVGCDDWIGPVPLCRTHLREFQRELDDRAESMADRAGRRRKARAFDVLYFATSEARPGQVKIGVTGNLTSRMRVLRAEPILTLPGSYDLEAFMHRTFQHEHVDGEWFRLSTRLVACIDEWRESNAA